MKIIDNGIIRDMTQEEITQMHNTLPAIPYEQRVANRIREVYSVDDELAILRQRYSKPEEFARYNAFAESVKEVERNV